MPLREHRTMLRQHVSFDDGGSRADQQQTALSLTDLAAAAATAHAAATVMSVCTQHAHSDGEGTAEAHSLCGCASHAPAVRPGEGGGGSGDGPRGSALTVSSEAPTAAASPALSRAPSDLAHASEGSLSLSLLPSLRLDRDDSELTAAAAPCTRSAPSTAGAAAAAPSTPSLVEGDCWVDASTALFSAPSTAWLPQRSFCEQLTAALEVEAAFDEARELAPPLIDLAALSSDETLAAARADAAACAGANGGGSGNGGSAAPSRGITPRPTHRHRRTLSNQITLVPAVLLHGGGPTGQLYSSLASSTSVSATATPNTQSTPVIASAIPSALFMPPSLALPSAHASAQGPPLLRSTSALTIHSNANVGYASALHGDGHVQAAPISSAASIHAAATVAAVALTARKRFSDGLPPLQPLRSPSPSPSASPTGDGPHLNVPLSARARAGSDSATNPNAVLTPLHSPPSASGSALHLPPPSASGNSRSPSRLPWLSSARSSADSSEAHSRVPSRSFVISPTPALAIGSAGASVHATPASTNVAHGSMLRSPSPATSGALSPLSRYSDDNAEFLNYRRAWELARHLNASLERIGHPPHYSRSFFFSAPAPMNSFAAAHADMIPPMHGASPRGCPEALQSPLSSSLAGGNPSPRRRRASTNMLAPDHNDGASGASALFASLGAAASEAMGATVSPRSSPHSHLPPRGTMLQLRSGMSKRASMPMPLTPTAASSSSPHHSPPSLRSPTDADSGSLRNLRFRSAADDDASDGVVVAAGAQWAVVSPPTPVNDNGATPSHSPRHSQPVSLSLEPCSTVLSMLVQTRLRGIASAALAAPSALSTPCAGGAFPPSPVPSAHCTSAMTSVPPADTRRAQCC